MNEFYHQKGSLPRDVRSAPSLRDALRVYVTKRLLHVADTCRQNDHDVFRKEFGLCHRRYANMLFMATEATQDVGYMTKSIITWIQEDFENAMTGAQKEAAGLCGAELTLLVKQYENR